ncbi:type VII secretion-associated protein [Pseudonocardia spirodelae]|uniref:Type VII secretion-associated protein n=1 Tax=Pseudonocardia spirodelae TaxID=3133431 RepID=A0ABU8T8I2_9PSEU
MSGYAVAVHDRPDRVLLAAADAQGVRLVAAAPAGTPPAAAVAAFFGDVPPAVVVRVGTTPGGPFPGAPRVLVVPAAVAVLGPGLPGGPVLVLDDDGATLVRDGVPGAPVRPGPGEVAALVRRHAVVQVVTAGPGVPPDAGCPVRAADGAWGPGTAAVAGAALLGVLAGAQGSGPVGSGAVGAGPVGSGPVGSGAVPGGEAPEPERGDRGPALVVAAAVLGLVLVAAGLLLPGGAAPQGPGAGVVVQYGYAAALPAGWEHTGGDPRRRRVLLTPAGRPGGADLLVLERSPLDYDASREPARARRELAAELGGAVPEPVTFGGRPVLRWTQDPGDGTAVDWHVVFEGGDELVAGCRRPAGEPVPPGCAEVVASLHRVR